MKNDYKIISVGGSIVYGKKGFDIKFLKAFRKLILKQVKHGHKFILVVGGGDICRQYQQTAKKVAPVTEVDIEWLGIQSTILNAHFLRYLFKGYVYSEVVTEPNHKVKTNKPIICAAGWKPGWSTDTDAVYLAKAYGAKELINLSNIEYVYTKDPKKYKTAKKIKAIDWPTFRRKIVGYKWAPGKNAPFDSEASRLAQKWGLIVRILKGTELREVEKVLLGKKFKGTTIQ